MAKQSKWTSQVILLLSLRKRTISGFSRKKGRFKIGKPLLLRLPASFHQAENDQSNAESVILTILDLGSSTGLLLIGEDNRKW